MKKTKTDSIGYAFYAFGGLGLEAVLLMVETNLYGQTSGAWSMMKQLAHWIIISFIWGGVGMFLAKQLPALPRSETKSKNFIPALIIVFASIIYTTISWGGFKPIIEWSNLGAGRFFTQYIYYAFVSLVITLIIAHGQTAFENWFGKTKWLPYGGVLLAATWGLVHILTQDASTGIFSVAQALLFGSIYMVFHKDLKISYQYPRRPNRFLLPQKDARSNRYFRFFKETPIETFRENK